MKYSIISERLRDVTLSVIRDLPIDVAHPYEIVIRQRASKRSLDQNALYWKRIDIIRQHVGDTAGEWYSAEETHEYFKAKFLPSRMVDFGDGAIRCRSTTTKLSTKQMTEYLEQVDRYCADRLHLILPIRTPE